MVRVLNITHASGNVKLEQDIMGQENDDHSGTNLINMNGNWNKEGSFAVDPRNKCKLEFSMISFMLHSIPVYLCVWLLY